MFKKAILATTLVIAASSASALTINDNVGGSRYIGAGAGADVYGNRAYYDVLGMNVSHTATTLLVDVVTNYIPGQDTSNLGSVINYGDLFISVNGLNSVASATDYSVNAYAIDDFLNTNNRWDYIADTSTGNLLSLAGANYRESIETSSEAHAGLIGQIRKNQAVRYDETNGNAAVAGAVAVQFDSAAKPYTISYAIDLADLGLTASSNQVIGLRWAMTCANDVTVGSYKVPEPGTLALFGLALAGLGFTGRNKKA